MLKLHTNYDFHELFQFQLENSSFSVEVTNGNKTIHSNISTQQDMVLTRYSLIIF
jgi:hypothetical protein